MCGITPPLSWTVLPCPVAKMTSNYDLRCSYYPEKEDWSNEDCLLMIDVSTKDMPVREENKAGLGRSAPLGKQAGQGSTRQQRLTNSTALPYSGLLICTPTHPDFTGNLSICLLKRYFHIPDVEERPYSQIYWNIWSENYCIQSIGVKLD